MIRSFTSSDQVGPATDAYTHIHRDTPAFARKRWGSDMQMVKKRKDEIRAQQIHNIVLQSRFKHQPSLLLHLEPAHETTCREARRETEVLWPLANG